MQELLAALRHDSHVRVRQYFKRNVVDLNAATVPCDPEVIEDPDEVPLLFWAIQSGVSREAIEILMEHGLHLDMLSREGLGAVDVAIKHRRRDIVALCGAHGISLTTSRRRSGLTPLMLAASMGDTDMVDLILKQGASPEDTDRRGVSAIEYARMLGQKYMVNHLVDAMKKMRDLPAERQKEQQGV